MREVTESKTSAFRATGNTGENPGRSGRCELSAGFFPICEGMTCQLILLLTKCHWFSKRTEKANGVSATASQKTYLAKWQCFAFWD